MRRLANVFPTHLGTPRCLGTPTIPRISFPQPPLLLGALFSASRMFPVWNALRNRLTFHPRGNLSSPMLPSPSSPQPPVDSGHHQTPPEPDCRKGTPVFDRTRGKWCCSVCDKDFRGRWGCRRHIETTGKRAKCLACGMNLKARDDLLLRHFTKYCKRDAGNPRLEDAFAEV